VAADVPSQGIGVSVTPGVAGVDLGTTRVLAAAVIHDPDHRGVSWTLNGPGCAGSVCGTISPGGVYTAPVTAPSPAMVTLTAASVTDSTKTASATILITMPGVLTVFVLPGGYSQHYTCTGTAPGAFTFAAYVYHDPANRGVSWRAAVGGAFSRLVTTSGEPVVYSVPTGFVGTTQVIAKSVSDPATFVTASVHVLPPLPHGIC
jgi:hypothetical protein